MNTSEASPPEHGRPPRSHQEIFSEVHSLAQAICNMTEAVPVECQPDGRVQGVNHFYAVVAYRWGDTNGHWYFVYIGPDQVNAVARASAEVEERGGKYGAAVYQFDAHGVDYQLIYYAPSMTEDQTATEPTHNHRKDYFERLGIFVDQACEGECYLPSVTEPNRLEATKVDVPEFLKQERTRQREILHHMTEADRHEPTNKNQ